MFTARGIAERCESLGRNCEFGLVQRNLGLEPISLLRWAGEETPDGLTDALRSDFAGLAEEADGVHAPHDGPVENRHWWLTCRQYGLQFHTDERPHLKNASEATAKVRPRLRRLAEKLMEDIRLGEKIFVYSSADFADPLDSLQLIDGFRGAGGCGPLLIVSVGREECVDRIDHNTFSAVMPKLTWWSGAVHLDQAAWERTLLAFGDALAKTDPSWSNLLR